MNAKKYMYVHLTYEVSCHNKSSQGHEFGVDAFAVHVLALSLLCLLFQGTFFFLLLRERSVFKELVILSTSPGPFFPLNIHYIK